MGSNAHKLKLRMQRMHAITSKYVSMQSNQQPINYNMRKQPTSYKF